jgi:membrane-associated phospholipid phosphatase
LGPEMVLLAASVVLLGVLKAVFGGRVYAGKRTALVPLLAVVLLSMAAFVRVWRRGDAATAPAAGRSAAWRDVLADWMPAVLCIFVYENLHDVVKLIHAGTLDEPLARADVWLFGTQPTLWLQPLTSPWLTDVMALAYASYFITPTTLGVLMYVRGALVEFREFRLAVIAAMCVGFIGYVVVPAIGPVHYLRDQYTNPPQLFGVWFYNGADAMFRDWRSIDRDCFPSLHAAVSTLTLIWAWKVRNRIPEGRVLLAVYLPLNIFLWFSTVYLRYHWVIDVLAGWLLAALVAAIVPFVANWYRARFEAPTR